MNTTEQPLRFLKSARVCDKIDRSRNALYDLLERDPTFPRPIKDGQGRASVNYWYEHEIEAWMAQWAEARRA